MHSLRAQTARIPQKWIIFAALFFIPLIRTFRVTDFYVVKDFSVEIFSVILLSLWVANPPNLKGRKFKPADIAGLGLWILMAINSIFIGRTYGTWTELTRFSSLFIIYFYFRFAFTGENGPGYRKAIITAVIAAGIISAIHGVFQFYGYDFGGWAVATGRDAPKAAFGHVNYLAGYLGLCLPLAIAGYLNKAGDKRTAAVCWLVVLTGSYALALTQTRGVWLALAFAVPVTLISYWLLYRKHTNLKRLLTISLTIFAALAIGLVPSPVNRNQSIGERGDILKKGGLSAQGDVTSGRVLIWLSSLDMAKKHPLTGVGLGNYLEQHQQSQASIMTNPKNTGWMKNVQLSKNAHNDFLQMLCELGAPGLLLYLGFIWCGAASFFGSLRKRRDPLMVGAGWACAASIIDGLTSFPLYIGPNALVFFVLMAMVASAEEFGNISGNAADAASSKAQPASAPGFRMASGLAALVMAYFSAQWFLSNVHFKSGEVQFARGNYVNAVAEYEKAIGVHPSNPRAAIGLGIANSNLGNAEKTRKYLSRPLPNVDQSIAWDALGAANVTLGDLNGARNALETGRFLYPSEPRYYINLSTVYYLLAKGELSKNPFLAEYYLDQGMFAILQYASMTKESVDLSPFVCGYRQLDADGLASQRPMPQKAARPFYPGTEKPFFEILYPYLPTGKSSLIKAFFWVDEPIKRAGLRFSASPDYPALEGVMAPVSNNGGYVVTFVAPALTTGQYPVEIDVETAKGSHTEKQILRVDSEATPAIEDPKWSYK